MLWLARGQYYIRDSEEEEIISAFVPLDHTSYFLYGGHQGYGSACITVRDVSPTPLARVLS